MDRRAWLPVVLWPCLLALGCNNRPPPVAPPKPPEVLVCLPVQKQVTDYEVFTGRTDAVEAVDVRARVTGYLDKVHFKDGDDVKQGQLLFEIDSRTYKAEYDKAEANVVLAEAHLRRLNADYTRAVTLLANKSLSREEFDKIAGDRNEAEASVGVAKASRDLAKLNLGFCKVTAPIGGRISRRLVNPGNLVKADDTVLTTIVDLDKMYAYFDVNERSLLRFRRLLREGKVKSLRQTKIPVDMGLSDEGEAFPHEGVLDFADNKVDPTTGSLWVRGVFDNKDRFLSPGLFVRVRVPIGQPHDALLVPERALGTDQGRKFVYVVNSRNEVEYRPVKPGPLHEGLRVIEQGLAADERVIVSGLQRVRPGV